MIKTEIKLKEPIYYAPSYSGAIKVSIGKICDDIAIVKQYSKKGIDFQSLEKALAEAIALRDEYNAAYQSVILLGVKREKEFNDLMAQLRKSIEESKAMRKGFDKS